MILKLEINVPCDGATPDDENTLMDTIERRGFSADLGVAERNWLPYATVDSIERRDA